LKEEKKKRWNYNQPYQRVPNNPIKRARLGLGLDEIGTYRETALGKEG